MSTPEQTQEFEDILNQQVGDIKPPPTFPVGPYVWRVANFSVGKSQKKETPYVEVQLVCVGATPEVDSERLAEFLGEGYKLEGEDKEATFYLTEKSLYRLTEFLKDHVQVPGAEDMPIRQALDLALGRLVVGGITHEAGSRPGQVYSNLTWFRPCTEDEAAQAA